MGTQANANTNIGEYIDRSNHPGTRQVVGLEAHFIQDGLYVDPLEISGVTVVNAGEFRSKDDLLSSIGNSFQIISPNISDTQIKYHWSSIAQVDANEMREPTSHKLPVSGAEDISQYNPQDGENASGVYRTGKGKYIVFLNNALDESISDLTSTYTFHGSSISVPNTATFVGDYNDIWTVRMLWQTLDNVVVSPGVTDDIRSIVQDFTLYGDYGSLVVATEPIMLETQHKLQRDKFTSESLVNLEIGTEIVIRNHTIDEVTKTVLENTSIQNFEAKLQKMNDGGDLSLPPYWTTNSYTDWKGIISGAEKPTFAHHETLADLGSFRVTSNNTLVIPCDFRTSPTVATMLQDIDMEHIGGTSAGTWRIKVRYAIMDQHFVSPWMYFEVKE